MREVSRSSFKTGSYQRVAGVDGHTSTAWVGEPPESGDLGTHSVRSQPPNMGFETASSIISTLSLSQTLSRPVGLAWRAERHSVSPPDRRQVPHRGPTNSRYSMA